MTSTDMPQTRPQGEAAPRPWLRGVYSLVFIVLFAVAETLLTLLAVVQFGWMIVYREPNAQLRGFGAALGAWMAQVARFQAAETEDKPFPWAPWPAKG